MTRRRDHILLALLTCCALALHGCSFTYVLDRPWIEVQSENFTITSDMSAKKTEALARTLELFRATVLLMTNTPSLESNVPTRVFFFEKKISYRPFRPGPGVVGYFHGTLRANFITMVESRSLSGRTTLRHEYVHFLMNNGALRTHPHWYNEGFPELLSTASSEFQHVAIGRVPQGRAETLEALPWIPMKKILAYDGTQNWQDWQVSMFYAESWALLHYLARDVHEASLLGGRVEAYVERIEAGETVEEACRAAFGMSTSELDREVKNHLTQGSFSPLGVRKDSLSWSKETRSHLLARSVVAERLGELALISVGDPSLAGDFFRAALAEDPTLARAHAGLGDALSSEGEWAEAERHYERAVELGPEDALNHLDLGEYWLARADLSDDATESRGFVEQARPHLLRALDLDDFRPEPWAIYGATFLDDGGDPAESLKWLETALKLLPSSKWTQLQLAEAYIAVDRKPDARRLLRQIVSTSHGGGIAQRATELLSSIEYDLDVPEPAEPQVS